MTLQEPTFSGASINSTSQVCTATMLVLLMVMKTMVQPLTSRRSYHVPWRSINWFKRYWGVRYMCKM